MRLLARIDRQFLVLAAVAGALCLVPLVLTSPTERELAVQFLIFALVGVAWNVMSGFTGQFSFGHAAFFGTGAYTAAVLIIDHGLSPWLAMACAGVAAAIFGLITGFLSFRYKLRGAYFALATFAFAEMARLIVLNSEALNAGVGYRLEFAQNPGWASLQFPSGSASYYFFALGLLVGALALTIVMMRSRVGHYMIAIRDDEEAAQAIGVDPMRYKLIAVAVSAAITGIAGAFFLQFYFFIDPNVAFGTSVSIEAILPAVIGGVGTIWGPLVGAAVLTPLAEVTAALTREPPAWLGFLEGRSGLDIVIYGSALIAIILFLPRGLYGTLARRWRR